ncbi:hypothetical protein [Agaribacter marinus]|uniref:Uncharacterized protein n=1 Tax=Agaribacter marinus TaxID=1431249 RepID=A0AA37SUT5_9ALTE|nr:hypothetical protein [Agaribacter marinus]GLR70251.1 hypothetical protein GCM10007852_11590 [Agaribacter marinus]
MATKTCSMCFGSCYIDSGEYERCYSCGGSGHGSYTDVNCSACGGSGNSSTTRKDQCWQCYGTGVENVPDAPSTPKYTKAAEPQKTSTKTAVNTATKGTKSTHTNKRQSASQQKKQVEDVIGGIAIIVGVIVAFIVYDEKASVKEAVISGIVSMIAAGVASYFIYYAVKLAVKVFQVLLVFVFWAAIIVFVANALDAKWAGDVIRFVEELIDSAGHTSAEKDSHAVNEPPYYYTSCIINNTVNSIDFQYRYENEGQWKSVSLLPKYGQWIGSPNDQKIFIRFDESYASGFQAKEYWLKRKYTDQECAGAYRYEFFATGSMIDAREL